MTPMSFHRDVADWRRRSITPAAVWEARRRFRSLEVYRLLPMNAMSTYRKTTARIKTEIISSTSDNPFPIKTIIPFFYEIFKGKNEISNKRLEEESD